MLAFSLNVDVYQAVLESPKGSLLRRPKTQLGLQFWGQAMETAHRELSDKRKNVKRLSKKERLALMGSKATVDAYARNLDWRSMAKITEHEVFVLSEGEEEIYGGAGVSEMVWKCVDEGIDNILDRDEAVTIVSDFMELHRTIYVEEGVSLWRLVKIAMDSTVDKHVVKKLRELDEKYGNVYDTVRDILVNTYAKDRMEVEMC